jgi:hypothetical protein
MINVAVMEYIDQAQRLGELVDSIDVVIKNMETEADFSAALQHHRDTVKELKDKIMDLGPLVDKILEDIEEL